jgi:hypothetical protein
VLTGEGRDAVAGAAAMLLPVMVDGTGSATRRHSGGSLTAGESGSPAGGGWGRGRIGLLGGGRRRRGREPRAAWWRTAAARDGWQSGSRRSWRGLVGNGGDARWMAERWRVELARLGGERRRRGMDG